MAKRTVRTNPAVAAFYLDGINETPVLDQSIVEQNSSGVPMGELLIDNKLKRYWLGAGLRNTPFELTNVLILDQSGEIPNANTLYNAGTLIINTVDNKVWVGTGNATTEGSFVPISESTIDLDGGTF